MWSKCRPEPTKAFTFQVQPVCTWVSGERCPDSRGNRGDVEMEKLPGSPSSEPEAEQAPSGRARPPSSPALAEFQQTCRQGLKPDLGAHR